MRVLWTARAEDDLLEIWRMIARDNPGAADRMLDGIDASARRLSVHPMIGRGRSELGVGVRSLVHGNYLIVYRPGEGVVEVLRCVHGKRDLRKLL